MRTSSSVGQFFRGKNLSLKDLQTKAKPPGQDRLGRARELSKLKCKYCKTTARLYGSRFVCDPCKKIKEEENTVTVVLEREKRLAQRRFGEAKNAGQTKEMPFQGTCKKCGHVAQLTQKYIDRIFLFYLRVRVQVECPTPGCNADIEIRWSRK